MVTGVTYVTYAQSFWISIMPMEIITEAALLQAHPPKIFLIHLNKTFTGRFLFALLRSALNRVAKLCSFAWLSFTSHGWRLEVRFQVETNNQTNQYRTSDYQEKLGSTIMLDSSFCNSSKIELCLLTTKKVRLSWPFGFVVRHVASVCQVAVWSPVNILLMQDW